MNTPEHPVCLAENELLAQCRVDRYRASGPGGQNRNKLETAVRLTHEPTGITVTGTERRSQGENLSVALSRMRMALAIGVRAPAFPGRDPSALWVSRRGADGRIPVNDQHPDLPVLIAEALDFLCFEKWQPGPAAQRLGVSSSQLIKLIQKDAHAFGYFNSERGKIGLGGMR